MPLPTPFTSQNVHNSNPTNMRFNKFLLHINELFTRGVEIINPIIGLMVFLTVLGTGADFSDFNLFGMIASLVAAMAIAGMICGPIAVLTIFTICY